VSAARNEAALKDSEDRKAETDADRIVRTNDEGRTAESSLHLAQIERERNEALELAATVQKENNSLRLSLLRVQEEADTLRVALQVAQANRFGHDRKGHVTSGVEVRTATFRAEQAEQRSSFWEAEAAALRRQVSQLETKLSDANITAREEREGAEEAQRKMRALQDENLQLEHLVSAASSPSLRETQLSARLVVTRWNRLAPPRRRVSGR